MDAVAGLRRLHQGLIPPEDDPEVAALLVSCRVQAATAEYRLPSGSERMVEAVRLTMWVGAPEKGRSQEWTAVGSSDHAHGCGRLTFRFDCRMPQLPSDEALQRYAASMEKIKVRTASALSLLGGSLGIPAVEAASLQTRLALEELMLSTLTTHEDSVQAVTSAFHKADHAAARKVLERINPGYWPTPTMQVAVEPGQWHWGDVEDAYLLKEDYGPRWGQLSAWCHARNPWSSELQIEVGVELVRSTIGLLVTLLNHHHVALADSDDLVNCMMQGSDDGRVHVTLFRKVGPSQQHRSPG